MNQTTKVTEKEWGELLADLIIEGIRSKLINKKPLTKEQQHIYDTYKDEFKSIRHY